MERWTNGRYLLRLLVAIVAVAGAAAYMYIQDQQDAANFVGLKVEARDAVQAAADWRKEHGKLPKPNTSAAPAPLKRDIEVLRPGTQFDVAALPAGDGLGWVAAGAGGFTVLAIQHDRDTVSSERDRLEGFRTTEHTWTVCPYNFVGGKVVGGDCRDLRREVRGRR